MVANTTRCGLLTKDGMASAMYMLTASSTNRFCRHTKSYHLAPGGTPGASTSFNNAALRCKKSRIAASTNAVKSSCNRTAAT